jgi:3-hydroxyisobutyrate dehydrogenase-like beta-hydroxyacid dehydrogenase
MMKIAWVGLGQIGTQMVKRALAAGHRVAVYARGEGFADVTAAGADSSRSYIELAAHNEVLVLCVYNDAQVREILFDHGALAAMRPDSVLIIHTTGSPVLVRELAARAPKGVAVLDVTFSGGPQQVAAGELTLMAGGEVQPLECVRPLLQTYAKRIYHVGVLGHGQMVKLLNNLLFASNLRNVAEVLRIAEQQDFDTSLCARVFQDCSGASFAGGLFQAPAAVDAVLERSRPYLIKDVKTALSFAATAGIDTSAFASTAAYFKPAD